MSVKARTEAVNRAWPEWQGSLINGTYPLRDILHASKHSAIFRTDARTRNTPDAAIRLVRAGAVLADLQLRYWRTAAALSHPHLMQLLDSGHCQLGDHPFLFVVMELADQTLAQVLPGRALTPAEAAEMLLPTLDVLEFLHRRNLVHGQLKPANFLVVGDQLKLAADTVRPVGAPRAGTPTPSLYDPPEAKDGRFTPASDVWSLGVTTVEALTQALPWPDRNARTAALPAALPPAFAPAIVRCLSHEPTNRPSVPELTSQLKRAAQVPAMTAPRAAVREVPRPSAPAQVTPPQPSAVPAIAVTALLTLVVTVVLSVRWLHGHPSSSSGATEVPRPPSAAPAPVASQTPASPRPAPKVSATPASPPHKKPAPTHTTPRPPAAEAVSGVAHTQLPVVPHSALVTIRGRIKVAVLVIVNRSGSVIDALLENPGPSPYFARLARDAASQWQFAPAGEQDSGQWLLRFEFTREGVTAHAAPQS